MLLVVGAVYRQPAEGKRDEFWDDHWLRRDLVRAHIRSFSSLVYVPGTCLTYSYVAPGDVRTCMWRMHMCVRSRQR